MKYKIRIAIPEDIQNIVDFNYKMALDTEGKELDKDILLQGVSNVFSSNYTGAFYIVAEKDSEVIAVLMVTREWSDWRNGHFLWIQSVYVKPEHRRKGIYSKLHLKVKEIAQKENCCGIRLYVGKNNSVAQSVYSSLGMQETYYKIFEEELR